jgi:hypothetical protein
MIKVIITKKIINIGHTRRTDAREPALIKDLERNADGLLRVSFDFGAMELKPLTLKYAAIGVK